MLDDKRPCEQADRHRRPCVPKWTILLTCLVSTATAAELQLLRVKPDPYGCPRPAPNDTDVPARTSFYFEIGFQEKNAADSVLSDSVAVRIRREGEPAVDMLKPGKEFVEGYSGRILPGRKKRPAMTVYIDGDADLLPSTTYIVSVTARSPDGSVLGEEQGSWRFTTAGPATIHATQFQLDLSTPPTRWHGGFFTGFCKPSFCTSASNRIPGYELMDRIRGQFPKAWSLQRDHWMTGMEHQPAFLTWGLPNVVRERETRRIISMMRQDNSVLLRIEDFFGHEQYGIASGRPLADDYHPGDEVLIADGVNHATAKVVAAVDNSPHENTLRVTPFDDPAAGWKIKYARPLPEKENPHAPGRFPPGGCHLRKLRPPGTPHYYWDRLDKEWDIAHRRFGRRLVVNFTDAPGDLSVDGRNWTFPKDYAQHHEVVRAYTSHLIERYGDACLEFVWSVFNEPDLASAFWISRDWNEVQRFYDYTVDAIFRAFEDHGYDSDRVFVGGLEIGAIFGTHIEGPILKIFLTHCSPKATCEGALPQNAAFADKRLDGKRSRRVEKLCRGAGGEGSPCDFISVHSYNASPMMAAKMIRAKQVALDIDEAYYSDLWVNSHESCPNWSPPPDLAAADSYLGNGYFPTWCADVARRQLTKAAEDSRYGFGESILTFWPWPNQNFAGYNAATRVIAVDEDGDGKKDRDDTVAMPILHFTGLMASMGDNYWPLPEQTVGGHVVSGFAAKTDDAVRVLLYSHNSRDIQSRSKMYFDFNLKLNGVPWRDVRVVEYRFDKDHNSYYRLGRELRDRPAAGTNRQRPTASDIEQVLTDLGSGTPQLQIAAVKKASTFGDVPEAIFAAAIELYEKTKHNDVRAAIEEAGRKVQTRPVCYRPDEVARVGELSELRATRQSQHTVRDGQPLRLSLPVAANGANFVVVQPADAP